MDDVAHFRELISRNPFTAPVEVQMTVVPNAILNKDILEGSKLLYGILLGNSWRTKPSTPTQRQLAQALGVTPFTIRKYIRDLQRAKLLAVAHARGGTRTVAYTLRPIAAE